MPPEERTARLTILIDPRKRSLLERLSAEEDLTSSQVVRRLIRNYIEERLGRPWIPSGDNPVVGREAKQHDKRPSSRSDRTCPGRIPR